jgi:hypothetical protein
MIGLLDVIPVLQLYPMWMRYLIALWLSLSFLLILLFLFVPRSVKAGAEVSIDECRVLSQDSPSCLKLDFLIRNSLPIDALLTELSLTFYGRNKPDGGLLAFQSLSTEYVLADGPEPKIFLVSDSGSHEKFETEIVFPYAGQDLAEVSIPLAQTIAKGGTDRFSVQLRTNVLPKLSHKQVEAKIHYNRERLTNLFVVTLRDRESFDT